ncbi:hypothetical protein HPP92_001157 [Vanilla planifolia]|uniref:Uncharacterized protein n=1 Tax=Vanilla planifolia TaxID=51239 RepID=A0A835VHB1_VANPL|nr:hypothetical protein HPP92_001157 [Vanilla planifolia]
MATVEEMEKEKDIDELPKNAANYKALTPLWFLERAATVHPRRPAVVYGAVTYTWVRPIDAAD